MNKLIQSSANPEKISLTVKGILMSIAPVVIGLMQLSGVEIAQSQYIEIVENITAILSTSIILIGTIRKVYIEILEIIGK
jgi:hypothetical protein